MCGGVGGARVGGCVEDVLERPDATDELGVNPELAQGIECRVHYVQCRVENECQGELERPAGELLERTLTERRGEVVVLIIFFVFKFWKRGGRGGKKNEKDE